MSHRLRLRFVLVVLLLRCWRSADTAAVRQEAPTTLCPTFCWLGFRNEDTQLIMAERCPNERRILCSRLAIASDPSSRHTGRTCDCNAASTTTPTNPTPPPPASPPPAMTTTQYACDTQIMSGYRERSGFRVNMNSRSATAKLLFRPYNLADEVTVRYEGKVLFHSIMQGREETANVRFAGNSRFIDVMVQSARRFSAWDLTVACP